MFQDWLLSRLAAVNHHDRILVRDPLQLLQPNDAALHAFASENHLTVIVAATNLVFRELYEHAKSDPAIKRILLVDRAPARRRKERAPSKAPPPFYPDFLADTPPEVRLTLDLRELLRDITGDPLWPVETNDPSYARIIAKHLPAVLRAHENLRTAHRDRFTDHDFQTIVAHAALGIPQVAFKKLGPDDLWRIALLGHEALVELDTLVPEVTRPIRDELRQAPAPFRWFVEREPATVLRAFYLSLILSQHLPSWRLLLANVDPSLATFTDIKEAILTQSAPALIRLDERQAAEDLSEVERSLGREALQFLFFDQMKINEPSGVAAAIEKERYSVLVRSLALLMAVDDLLAGQTATEHHRRLASLLFPDSSLPHTPSFVDSRTSESWTQLRDAYRLALEVQQLRSDLAGFLRQLKVKKTAQLSYGFFWQAWNGKRINRLEYYLSALGRLIDTGNLLPREEANLPAAIGTALDRIRQRVQALTAEIHRQLDEVNIRFQELVAAQYSQWLKTDGEVHLTSQFIRRCLKPNWDPQTEKAVVLIFDGMRYDIWDEMLRPMLLDRLELRHDLPAASLLPTETEISRWALAAGAEPATFWPRKAENVHLTEALRRELGLQETAQPVAPEGSGVGETVRYRAGNLDYYIFEFCDKELHKIQVKTLPDGRPVPTRPLAFIYEQHLKSIIDNEVMAIVRNLAPGTKVFITADHGFGPVPRERIWLESAWLNEPHDCAYLNARLKTALADAGAPQKVRQNVWEFPVGMLGMPSKEDARDSRSGQTWQKQYASIIFPKTGYALSRPGARFNPDAYTHGGISVQELMIPMVVLQVKDRDQGLLVMDPIQGPTELIEGQDAEFRLRLGRAPDGTLGFDDLRVDLDASIAPDRKAAPPPGAAEGETDSDALVRELPKQVIYVPATGTEAVLRFRPEPQDVGVDERRAGVCRRVLTVTATYRDVRKTFRKSRTLRFAVQLSAEQVIRRVGNLGSILGLAPKKTR